MKVLLERVRVIFHAEDPQSWYCLGVAYGNKRRWREALTALEHALKLDSQHDASLEAMGDVYLATGQAQLAAKYYHESARLDIWRRNPQRWNNLGIAYGKLGLLDNEISAYRKALDYDRQNSKTWRNLITAFYNARKFGDVVAVCEEALKQIPNNAHVWFDLGNALEELNNLERAAWAYAEAWRLRPEFPGPWINLIKVRVKLKRFDEAASVCEELAQFSPKDHGRALAELCDCYIWAGHYEPVDEILSKLSRIGHDQVGRLRGLLRHRTSPKT